jgi:hypothetical protein
MNDARDGRSDRLRGREEPDGPKRGARQRERRRGRDDDRDWGGEPRSGHPGDADRCGGSLGTELMRECGSARHRTGE